MFYKLLILSLVTTSIPASAFAFGPCSNNFPSDVSYMPTVAACGGKAAVLVMGRYYNSFSTVVRDCNNNDRDPCDKGPQSCASNFSSPFKAQKIIRARVGQGSRTRDARMFCLKESGSSDVYKLVRRITIKLVNPVRKPSDVAKICLRTRTSPVRGITILSTSASKVISNTAYTSKACDQQPYLACDYSYASICPRY